MISTLKILFNSQFGRLVFSFYFCINKNSLIMFNNKHYTILILFIVLFLRVDAQNIIVYQSYSLGSKSGDTSKMEIVSFGDKYIIKDIETPSENLIPGLATATTYVDYEGKKVYSQLKYSDSECYYSKSELKNNTELKKLEDVEKILGYKCKKMTTSINSNTIDIWYAEQTDIQASPMPGLGFIPGTVMKIVRNGSYITEVQKIKKDKNISEDLIPQNLGIKKTGQELSNLKRDKLIIKTSIFQNDSIHWGDTSKVVGDIPFDTTLHFAGGTLILKRINIHKLPSHYQLFIEIIAHSNGDAYDRTGSVFVIPQDKPISFAKGLTEGINSLPIFLGKDGEKYQGIRLEQNYLPVVELVRFFTPFGVGHFNERVKIGQLEWEDESYYKQEVSDLRNYLSGDVLIGAYIGNYDDGGHKISMNLLAYPGDYVWEDSEQTKSWELPLFNTCNIMEMGGQNYGKLFGTDSLNVEFSIPENAKNIRLRYISTGHGGWDGGDEFNPKENIIIIDGEKRFSHTPWREDCSTFRELNPVSGNFWNGISSSDFSRSGWCPGTATQPVYFNLTGLKPGKHTITIAIPQGKKEGGSFSHWNISGMLLGEIE